jgi:hypothetical protein
VKGTPLSSASLAPARRNVLCTSVSSLWVITSTAWGSFLTRAKGRARVYVVRGNEAGARPERRRGSGPGGVGPLPLHKDTLRDEGASPHRPKGLRKGQGKCRYRSSPWRGGSRQDRGPEGPGLYRADFREPLKAKFGELPFHAPRRMPLGSIVFLVSMPGSQVASGHACRTSTREAA